MASQMFFPIFDLAGKIFDRVLPDRAEAEKAKLELLKLASEQEFRQWLAQADIIKTEAASGNWLAASWRPITMLTFTALIVARWFGLAAPNLSEAEYLALWDIVQLGLGGYVIGRSVEKIAPAVANALGRK